MNLLRISAAAALGLGCAAAFAQSQVTVFGLLDAGITRLNASGAGSQTLLNTDGNTSSRLGFRGTEDLGDGFKANFWIEAAISPDTGLGGASSTNNKDSVNTGALTFGRRATVGLQSGWGELRLGRDYVPSFSNLTTSMHPFGTNGVGSSGAFFYPVNTGGTTVRTNVRASNSIGYFLPNNSAGVYGAVMVASGEQPSGTSTAKDGNHQGIRLGWRNDKWNVAAATGKTRYATGDYTQSNIGANVQVGPAKLMALWGENKVGITRTRAQMIGTQWTVSDQGELRFAYSRLQSRGVANDATHWAIGYVYELSRRTGVYATAARITNKDRGNRFNVGLAATTPGGSSSGVDIGMRHSF